MANELEKSIFFAGGKTIFPETNEVDAKGLKLEQMDDGRWRVTLEVIIAEAEAEGVIHKYSDFAKLEENEIFSESFPNQVYFEAFDSSGSSKNVLLSKIQLNVLNAQKTEVGGEIVLRMTPKDGVGKTQNAFTRKTQNVDTTISPGAIS